MFRRYLTEEAQQKLLSTMAQSAAVIARRDFACVRLLNLTGLRIGEFSRLTVGDADAALQTRYLFIPREYRKGKQRDHTVLLTRPGADALEDLLRIRAEIAGCDVSDLARRDALVVSRKGVRMSVRAYEHRFKAWARATGLPEAFSPHWLRHTRSMNIMRRSTSNNPRGIVQASLGHVSIASTGIYTRVTQEELAAQLAIVDGAPRLRKRDMRRHFCARGAS